MELGNIPYDDFKEFIIQKFRESKGNIVKTVLDEILEFTRGHPYFTQQLCHELWYITRNVKDWSNVEKAIENILAHHEVEYEHIWDGLRGKIQCNLLIGMAKDPKLNVYSSNFISKYNVKTPSHVQRALKLLEAKGLVENSNIADIFFAVWLKQKM